MSNRVEKNYPWVGGLVAGGLGFYFLNGRPLPADLNDLLSAIINVSAIAVGFLATAKSILISIQGSRIIRQFKSGGGARYAQLIDYLMTAIYSCFALAALSTIGLLIDLKAQAIGQTLAVSIWMMCLVYAGLTCQRVIAIFTEILKSSD